MTGAKLRGKVVHGDHRGRDLGFPTANVEVAEGEVPDDGVYQGWLEDSDGARYVAAVSVGGRPTYYDGDGPRLVEVYVLDFDGDLYDHRVTVEVGERVRSQVRFATSEELVAQMHSDVEAVRGLSGTSR